MTYLGPGLGVEDAVWHEGGQTEASEGYTLHPLEALFLVFATKTSGFHLGSQLSHIFIEHGQSIDSEASLSPYYLLRPGSRYSFSVAW